MAQTKRKRRSKHRGNAAGNVESRGRTGRKPTGSEKKSGGGSSKAGGQSSAERRADRLSRPPTWRSAINRAVISALALFAVLLLAFGRGPAEALGLAAVAVIVYVPIGYVTDSFIYKRRIERDARRTHGESS